MESVTRTIAPALRRGALALLAAVLGAMALAGCGANGTSDSSGAYEKTNYLTDQAANRRAVDALESVGPSLEESGDPTFAGAWIDSFWRDLQRRGAPKHDRGCSDLDGPAEGLG